MTDNKKSGLDQLMDALRQSGMDVEGTGKQRQSAQDQEPQYEEENQGAQNAQGQPQNPFDFSAIFGGKGSGKKGERRKVQIPDVEMPFEDKISNWGKKAFITFIIILILVVLAAYWWFHPAINIHSIDCWIFFAIFICAPAFIVFKTKQRNYTKGTKKVAASAGKAKTFKTLSLVPVVLICIGLIGGLLSFSFIPGNAKKYASILNIQSEDFATDISAVNYSEVPIIDHDAAEILGDREMGTIADYVSQFNVNSLYSQINYQNTPVRVSPLDYADLIKWLFNRSEGIPAYVIVDMTTQEANVVRISDVDGTEGQGIKYSESEPLARNIERYVQLSFPFYMFDEFSFEIDEEGHPWWICPVQTRTIGLFGGTTISRVVLCDAVTGECIDLAIEDCPEWVDRAYPSDLLIQQYNWYGAYLNGWINSWLGQSGVVKTTPGTDGESGYNYVVKDDDVWVYTGVTSATSDSSIIGFVLINQRTADAHFYSVVGATEDSAMDSAEGLVQQYSYTATFPLLINVANRPTYFMALKDSSGYVKQFAMMDVNQINIGATAATVADTQSAYLTALANNNVDVSAGGGTVVGNELTGTISSMIQIVVDGNTHYYVMINGDDRIFDFAMPAQLGMMRKGVGSTITFTFASGTSVCSASLVS